MDEQLQFSFVDLKAIDLPMFKKARADDDIGINLSLSLCPEPRIRGKRPILAHPGTDSALRDIKMESAAHDVLSSVQWVAEIKRRDCFKDRLQWIGLVFACVPDESVSALIALKDRSCSKPVLSLAFFDDVGGVAGRGRLGVLLLWLSRTCSVLSG